jgi:hypothetical protein
LANGKNSFNFPEDFNYLMFSLIIEDELGVANLFPDPEAHLAGHTDDFLSFWPQKKSG